MLRKQKIFLLSIDLLVSIVVITAILLIVHNSNEDKQKAAEQSYIEQASVLENVAKQYMKDNMLLCNHLCKSMDGRSLSEQEIHDVLINELVGDAAEIHFVWADELVGFANKSHAANSSDFSADYRNRNIFEDGEGVRMSERYICPLHGASAIAFYNTLTVEVQGEQKKAYLLYVIPEASVLRDWEFPTTYDDAAVSLIKNDGSGTYILRSTEMKNENFFDYIYSYNRNTLQTKSLFEEIETKDSGYFYGVDYRGENKLYTYNRLEKDSPYIMVTAVGLDKLNYEKESFVLPTVIFVSMMVLLILNLAIYNGLASKLTKNEESLTEALALANRASKAKTDFLNNMSHDIRTPMNAIIGYTELAESHIGDEKRVKDYLGKISLSSKHLLSLINDILEMSRIESGRVRLSENPEHLPEILQNMRTLFHTEITAKNLEFSMDISDIKNEDVICDKLRLNQILINLLGNAIKFTNPGGKIGLRVIQKEDTTGENAHFEFHIMDNGIGISKEMVEHIFEPFERGNTSSVSKIQGTGLGLSITKNLVELMGGTISVESEEGKGSEFVVDLSFKVANEPASKRVAPDNNELCFDGKRVLLVEDNSLNSEIASIVLRESGFTVNVATNGAEAVEAIKKAPANFYDIILMDLRMPVMDGFEATRQIRALDEAGKSDVKIVAMTANAFDEDIKACLEVGMSDHIAKPIERGKMLETIAKYIL